MPSIESEDLKEPYSTEVQNNGLAMSGIKKIASFILTWKRKIAIIAFGHFIAKIIDLAFDYGLYVYVIAVYGPLKGGAYMMIALAIFALVQLKLYDWSGRDWLGFEALKELKEGEPEGFWAKKLSNIVKKGDIYAFFFLSYYYGPFCTSIYLRKGKYNGLKKRGWLIFLSSTVVCNAYWTIQIFASIEVVKYAWKNILKMYL